jgi:hypothetical protein
MCVTRGDHAKKGEIDMSDYAEPWSEGEVGRDWSKDGLTSKLSQGVEAVRDWEKSLDVPEGTVAAALGTILGTVTAALGTILGTVTVAAFTKAWPRLKSPVTGVGYAVAGYAVYRLVKHCFESPSADSD